ncbi:carbamoyltransferase N-terminal domain-containing protein [Candidatus Berkiella aquae]|uniref:Carbamoyltransferase n=1 Tax=Candidatus Berkiella aquae TaxID=295108 RepID=A0A0Q9YI79_9GAMM|nr:carbamoyltransferase [Candidatus Berkiella aquae]MCS5712291.1 carbamoyltransferase [Candidatus Berkiella aquae]
MSTTILGISAFYHDSAAAIVQDGKIISCAQEERFTRKKHDPAFPTHAIEYCMKEAGVSLKQVNYVVFYDKPLVKFERLLETYLAFAPRGFRSFLQAMPIWMKEKLFLKDLLKKSLAKLGNMPIKALPPLLFTEHHQAHAASAFFPSPFERAAVMCLDGVGEWATSSVWLGNQNKLELAWELDFPHSLGLLYSAFTYYTGFKVNSGEYKLMGLAPYGEPKYVDLILDHLLDLKEDGTFRLNMDYFNYPTGLTMTNRRFDELFGGPPRQGESTITQREMDIASSIQAVTENIVLKLANTVKKELSTDYLCLAGGVALNCVANGKIHRQKLFKDIFVQPAAGDAGGALGAALSVWYEYLQKDREPDAQDSMGGSYLGPKFSNAEMIDYLESIGAKYHFMTDDALLPHVADLLANENVIGWFQGRMEFGPRALGGRSIIGDARSPKMQSIMNLKIKYRESFRPFAPVIKHDQVSQWFEFDGKSPYMLMVAPIRENHRVAMTEAEQQLFGIEKLNVPRSTLPAITHVDYSARLQTVHPETNPRFYELLNQFEKITGCPVLINTSFNVRGEPIVHCMADAYRCFMRTEMDYLILENLVLCKKEQPAWQETSRWQEEFALD